MKICDSGHEEICYEDHYGHQCPICEQIKDLETDIDDKDEEISEIQI